MKKAGLCIIFISVAMLWICSCSSEQDSIPTGPPPLHLNKQDSLALIEIWKAGGGEYWSIKWDLNNLQTWGGVSAVISNPETNECRVIGLNLACPSFNTIFGILSPEIVKLTELRFLYLGGKGFGGYLPEGISKLKKLKEVSIKDTYIGGKIPVGIVSLPELRVFQIEGGLLKEELPADITQTASTLLYIRIRDNLLSGKIPSGIKVPMDLDGNEFTEYPFEYLVKDGPMISLRHNKITGLIPDSILNDPYWKDHFEVRVHPQKEHYGYSNIPDEWWKPSN